jgi:hypothetical protein
MTLTRQLPSLRRTLPDPLVPDLWPEATIATTTDIVVSGISLVRLVEVYGTPCSHRGAAVLRGTGGRPSPTATTTVTVARVNTIGVHSSGRFIVQTDARLDDPRLIWSEIRLINRASTAHTGAVLLDRYPAGGEREGAEREGTDAPVVVDLPLDLRVGDLLVLPSHPQGTPVVPATWLSDLE